MKKLTALCLSVILAAGMLSGCGTYQNNDTTTSDSSSKESSSASSEPTETSATSDDFSMAYNGVVTLNPIMAQSSNDYNMFYLTQLALVRYYGDQIINDGAESYDVSEDYTVYTFHLRDGLTWSDGVALTAKDYEYAFYCLLNPEMGSPSANSWFAVKNSAAYNKGDITNWEEVGVKALDDKTLEVTLEYPSTTFEKTLAVRGLYPLRQDFVEQIGQDKLGSSVDTMLYSGPYVITSWVLESSMELVKNDSYWDSANSFPTKNLHLIEVKDINTKVAMFENGEVDAIEQISSQYYDYLSEYLYTKTGGGIMFLWYNQQGTSEDTAKLLSNTNFRQALNYGFDRQATVQAVDKENNPYNRLVDSNFVTEDGKNVADEYSVNGAPLNGDIEKAKEYLNKALEELGYSDVSQLPTLSLVTWDAPSQKLLLETIIDQWKQNLGVTNVQLNQYVIGTAIGNFYSLDYDIFCITWETDVLSTDIMEAFVTGGEVNYGIWKNEQYDTLVAQAIAEIDPVKKATLAQQAEQIFLDDGGVQPIYETSTTSAVQTYVEGFQMSGISSGYQFNNLVVNK